MNDTQSADLPLPFRSYFQFVTLPASQTSINPDISVFVESVRHWQHSVTNVINLTTNINNIASPDIHPILPIHPIPPDQNYRLSSNIMDAHNSIITIPLLSQAYMEVVPAHIRTEPDQLWAKPRLYAHIRQLITEQPTFIRTLNQATTYLSDICFRAATLVRYPDNYITPDNEALFYNTQYPQLSIRIVNICIT